MINNTGTFYGTVVCYLSPLSTERASG